MKRLDSIDARFAARSSAGEWMHDPEDGGAIFTVDGESCVCTVQQHGNANTITRTGQQYSWSDAEFIARAPADVTVLMRVARALTAAECEYLLGQGRDCIQLGAVDAETCWPCRGRRLVGDESPL